MTTKDITIKGGVWADTIKTVYSGGTIPSGLTFQEFLQKMLFTEKYANNISATTVLNISCSNPGKGINLTNNSYYEVGTKLILNAISVTDTNVNSHYIKTTGLEYGYKIGANGGYKNDTIYIQNLTPELVNSSTKLEAKFTGFTNLNGSKIETVTGSTSLSSMEMYVGSGSNTINISQSGKTYKTDTTSTIDKIYVANNMGTYKKENSEEDNIYTPKISILNKRAYSNTVYNITGYRNIFYGVTNIANDKNMDENDYIKFIRENLNRYPDYQITTKNKSFELITSRDEKCYRMIIASPIEIDSVIKNNSPENITNDLKNSKKVISIPGDNNYSPIDYFVYDCTWVAAFDGTWTITLK